MKKNANITRLKKHIIYTIHKLLAIKRLQFIYSLLFRISLKGMNYGSAARSPAFSGEKKLLKTIKKQLPNNPVMFDVGANQGQYTSLLFSEIPEALIYSFEPSLSAFNKLNQKLGDHRNIHFYNLGLSDVKGVKKLYASKEASVQSTFISKNQSLFVEDVSVTTIDLFCEENDIEHIHFLKIDVEGFEFQVLSGAKRLLNQKKIDFIQFEFGNHQKHTRHFLSDFHELLGDFTLYRVVQNGIQPLCKNDFEELFLVTNYFAVAKNKLFK